MICAICGQKSGKLTRHIKQHNITPIEYYNKYLKLDSEGACAVCGNPTKFINISRGYNKYCCPACSNRDPKLKEQRFSKARKTCLEKYGVDTPAKSSIVREKMKQTCLEKYGVEYATQADVMKKHSQETFLEKYGVTSPQQVKEIREKTEKTTKERYGGLGLGSKEIKNKAQQTCLERYGAANPFSAEEIKKNIEQTNLERYGVPYFCMTDTCRNLAVFSDSSCNKAFTRILEENDIDYSREFPIDRKSFDFKVGNNLIEINPTATHNSTWGWRGNKEYGLDKYYHRDKNILAKNNGYRCICIWDWDDIDKIVSLLKRRESIYARKCIIKLTDVKEEKEFLNKYHLQGYIKSSIGIGLYYNNELVSIMTFGKPRYNKKYEWELLRYCSSLNVIGGAEKLWAHFIRTYSPASIISYCDNSKFNGDTYIKLGFILSNDGDEPSKHWVHYYTKKHITDNLLRQRGFDQLLGKEYGYYGKGSSNEQLMLDHGFVEIYDCGQSVYVWKTSD